MGTPEERFEKWFENVKPRRQITQDRIDFAKIAYLAACEEDVRIAENYRDPGCIESVSGKNIAKAIRGK